MYVNVIINRELYLPEREREKENSFTNYKLSKVSLKEYMYYKKEKCDWCLYIRIIQVFLTG